jgi:CPA2 family monovalent cation:H+ antiporter-2
MLDRHQFAYVAVDKDPTAIAEYRQAGRQVFYGDAANPSFLESCGLVDARAVIVTIHTKSAIDAIVKLVRKVRPDIAIIARARDADHARELYAIDVTDAVPETVEASLQLSEATLMSIGLPAGPVIASIHQLRDEFRQELQEAAGRQVIHSIRPKTLRRS